MLGKLFGRKPLYKEHHLPTVGISFLGAPTGNGIKLLHDELAAILNSEGNTEKAYLSRVKYADDDAIRVALVISGKDAPRKMATVIARACQPLVAIDILFLQSLSAEHQAQFQLEVPFYVAARI